MALNRRDFLKISSLSGLSLSLGAFPSLACTAKAETDKKGLGVALVGLGYYSGDLLAPALQLTEHCYLAGIVTGTPAKIPTWQEKYGIKDQNVYNYENMHTIADNDEIDVVYIVVPTGLHAKYAKIAANAGKHVWCEKPMAMNIIECQDIIDTCKKNDVYLSVGYRVQHEPNTRTIMGYAKDLPYGNITELSAMAGYKGGVGSGWRFQKELGGGALYDMGVYTVNALRYGSGMEPLRVISASHSTNRPEAFKEVDETTEYRLEFPNGVMAYGKTSVGETFNQLKVTCEKGWYEISPMQSYSGVGGRTSDGKNLDVYLPNQQARQMDDDALAIMNKTEVMVGGEEGLKDIRIVNAIREAAATEKVVDIV
ncbi:MAG: Gfo/Idh/MocA family oxidoreductase [Bacteroidota bacterium]